MIDRFHVRISVRSYELDSNGHVASAIYLQYSQHARWECLRAAGVDQEQLIASGVGPVNLQETIKYHSELRGGDEVDITCAFVWGEGKTFRVDQEFRRPDGSLVAEVANTGGLLDLEKRRLVAHPGERWRAVATSPQVLGL